MTTTTLPKTLGYNARCMGQHTAMCPRYMTTRPKSAKCPRCGSRMMVSRGYYILVEHGTPYTLDNAHRVYGSYARAQRECDRLFESGETQYVVRFVSVPDA